MEKELKPSERMLIQNRLWELVPEAFQDGETFSEPWRAHFDAARLLLRALGDLNIPADSVPIKLLKQAIYALAEAIEAEDPDVFWDMFLECWFVKRPLMAWGENRVEAAWREAVWAEPWPIPEDPDYPVSDALRTLAGRLVIMARHLHKVAASITPDDPVFLLPQTNISELAGTSQRHVSSAVRMIERMGFVRRISGHVPFKKAAGFLWTGPNGGGKE
jgi:hypothetical protein